MSIQSFSPDLKEVGPSFQNLLAGKDAFYEKSDYFETTLREFASDETLAPCYSIETESLGQRIGWIFLCIIVFPYGIYQLVHSLAGKVAIIPAATPRVMGYPSNYANQRRLETPLDGEWKYKRITVEVDGHKIDAMIMGKAETLGNGRWVLASNGNAQFYEDKLQERGFKRILTAIEGNAIVFNYPGVGASTGMPSRATLTKAYKAMLTFLEDAEKGVGAKEIVGIGHSIGGGIQGEALNTHELKEDISYVFVKSRSFSDLASAASGISAPLGPLVKMSGWNLGSVESSKKLQVPEIILQSAHVDRYQILTDASQVVDDGVISQKASLAYALLNDESTRSSENRVIIGIPEMHNDALYCPEAVAKIIDYALEIQKEPILIETSRAG